jgi:hypothetical protein
MSLLCARLKISRHYKSYLCIEAKKYRFCRCLTKQTNSVRKSASEKVRPQKCVRKRVTFRPFSLKVPKGAFYLRICNNCVRVIFLGGKGKSSVLVELIIFLSAQFQWELKIRRQSLCSLCQ